MALDLTLFADKLRRVRKMLKEELPDVARATSITEKRLEELESGSAVPTGDEVLILADHFNEDFRFFVSNEQRTVFERTEKLLRAHDGEFSASDRRTIQEFLFLCDNEEFLSSELGRRPPIQFSAKPRGTFAKGHGLDAARELRDEIGLAERDIPDVFHVFRSLGFHVFRRSLDNYAISGLFVDHPAAGPCLLINYSEDVYRQRFTVAHEAAHAFFDRGDEFVVSFSRWSHGDLREIRADTFAGAFLVPPGLFHSLGTTQVTEDVLLDLAAQLQVSVAALLKGLVRDNVVSKDAADSFRTVRLPRGAKTDPELPPSLTATQRTRKGELLRRGLSSAYVDLCLEAHHRSLITRARLAEVLLVDDAELDDIQKLFLGRVS